jgi:hypothetical protein
VAVAGVVSWRSSRAALGAYWAERHQPRPDEMERLQAIADTAALALAKLQSPPKAPRPGRRLPADLRPQPGHGAGGPEQADRGNPSPWRTSTRTPTGLAAELSLPLA